MTVPFYFDHNMQFAVVTALRERGMDVLTTREDGYDRHPDDQVLVRAQKLARVVVTHDQDFLELATECIATSTEFPGIIFCHLAKSSIGGLVADLKLIADASTYEELRNQGVWEPR
ncbi:MAG: DUF5615 family PIN-like protein [Planctomycetota bacterium]